MSDETLFIIETLAICAIFLGLIWLTAMTA
jgi:hypothetical protein